MCTYGMWILDGRLPTESIAHKIGVLVCTYGIRLLARRLPSGLE